MRLSVVVLPEPLGPSSVTKLPAGMSSETSSTAVTAPKRLVSRSRRSAAPAGAARGAGAAEAPSCPLTAAGFKGEPPDAALFLMAPRPICAGDPTP